MRGRASERRMLCAAALAAVAVSAAAQTADVPYVPTPANVVEAMLDLAKVGPDDYLIDLGSGDGRIVIAAAKERGARGLGVEIDGTLVADANRLAQRAGVSDRARFVEENLHITDFRNATVVTMYLFPRINLELRPRLIKELKPGARVVSHEFDMADWMPDARVTVAVPDKPYGEPRSSVYLWIVPADVSGTWRWRSQDAALDDELTLRQRFQMIEGEGRIGGRAARIVSGRVRGDTLAIELAIGGGERRAQRRFAGRIEGDAVRGTLRIGEAAHEWRAVRTARGTMRVAQGAFLQHAITEEQQ